MPADDPMPGDPMQRFARDLRLWARRPTEASPRAARARLLDAIGSARSELRPWRPRLATALVAMAIAAVLFVLIPSREPQKPRAEEPVTQRYLVVTLASGNQLYVQLSPPTPRRPRS